MNIGDSQPVSFQWDTNMKYPVFDMSRPPSNIFLGYTDGTTLYKPGVEIEFTGDTTLTGVWIHATAIVTFDYGYEGSPSPIELETELETNIIPPEVERQGYSFKHWINVEDNTTHRHDNYIWIDGNATFEAVWEKDPIITFSYYDGNESSETVKFDTTYNFPKEPPIREGYEFKYWVDEDNPRNHYSPGSRILDLKSDVSLTAEWKILSYSVTYDPELINDYEVETVEYGSSVTLPVAPNRVGLKFIGWTDGVNTYEELSNAPIYGDTVFTSLWEKDIEAENSFKNYELPRAVKPINTEHSSSDQKEVEDLIAYFLSIVEQNISVNDYLEAYDILIALMENPQSCDNEKVNAAYTDFLDNYINNDDLKIQFLDRKFEVFRNWDKLYGYKDSDGNILIEPKFYSADSFHNGVAHVVTFPEKKDCYIDYSGEIVIGPSSEYWLQNEFGDGVCLVDSKKSYTGFTTIDITGKINTEFGNVLKENNIGVSGVMSERSFTNGLLIASCNGYEGYIDKTGEWKIAARFEYAKEFSKDGYALVSFDGDHGRNWSIIDKNGNFTKPTVNASTTISSEECFNDGVLLVTWDSGTYYLYDHAGTLIAEFRSLFFPKNSVLALNEGLFAIVLDDGLSDSVVNIYDINGKCLYSYNFSREGINAFCKEITPFQNGKMKIKFYEYGPEEYRTYSIDYFGNIEQID